MHEASLNLCIHFEYLALLMFFENLAFETDIKHLVKLVVYLTTA